MTTLTFNSASERASAFPTLLIVVAAIGFGTVPFFARSLTHAGMMPAAVAFYRYAFTALIFLPFLRLGKASWRITAWGILSGVIVGLGWIGYVEALDVLPVSTAGVIYMTYPMFTVLTGWIFFGDKPGPRSLVAAAMVLAAAVLVMSPTAVGTENAAALLLAFLAPIGFAIGINILARKLVGIPPLSRMACKSLGSVLGLSPLIFTSSADTVLPSSFAGWSLIAGIALVTALLPQLLYNVYAPAIGATRTAMAGSIELPTMFVVGWLAFGESLNAVQFLAGIIVMSAIMVTPSRSVRNVRTNLAMPRRRN